MSVSHEGAVSDTVQENPSLKDKFRSIVSATQAVALACAPVGLAASAVVGSNWASYPKGLAVAGFLVAAGLHIVKGVFLDDDADHETIAPASDNHSSIVPVIMAENAFLNRTRGFMQ